MLKKYAPVFLLPLTLAFIVFFAVPFLGGLYLSFTEFTTVENAHFVGISNYLKAFGADSGFLNALWFTVRFTLVSVISVNLIAFALAIVLTKALKGVNFFRTVFFLPNLIGGIVLGYIWNVIINGILSYFGVDITFSASYGFWGLVVLMNWQMIGYMMIIYIAGLQSVDRGLIEAAHIDGANSRQALFRVTVPSLMPSVTICTFLTLTNSFKLFDQNLALTGGAPGKQTSMLALDIYDTFYGRIGWQGVGQAKAVMFFVIVAFIALVQLMLTRSKEVEA
ncbi:MAG: sugar ABC transporter permease [Clostridia bacterium]|nr:sugar ABC transporter permease [Clostridia bacterium]